MTNTMSGARAGKYIVVCIIGGLFLAAVFRNAWVADDAYIVFRSIEQLFASHGPRWNLVDRVEIYTSPLWFWMLSATRIFSINLYLNAIVVSLGLLIVVLVILYRFLNNITAWALALALLALSCAFMDFTTSGLEYSLIYLLCIYFFYQYYAFCQIPSGHQLKRLCLLGSIFLITRHDLLLTILPAISHGFWTMRKHMDARTFLINITYLLFPLLAWTLFSLFYYGLPLPNTVYAKLNIRNIPHLQMIEQGLFYFYWGITHDLLSILLIFAAIIAGFFRQEIFHRVISATLLLVVTYVIWVSGDFMAGRFYSYLVLIAVMQLLSILTKSRTVNFFHGYRIVILTLCLGLYTIFYPHNPLNTPNIYSNSEGAHRVSNERGNYSTSTSIWVYMDPKTPYFPYFDLFEQAHHFGTDGKKSERFQGTGMIGYGAPLDFYIDDFIGLSDFFRSRLPMDDDDGWLTGHSTRYYPEGYPESLIEKKAHLKDPYLNEYLEIIMLITQSDDLWNSRRLITIAKFNLGMYDYLLDKANLHWTPKNQMVNRACNHSWQRSPWLRIW